jgi:RND family efflux transporter MFP subunit
MVALYARVTGFVEEVLVDRGARVQRGQLLARLAAPELAAQRAEAEAKLAAVRSTLERQRAAAATPGAIAQHDLELDEAAVHAEEARVQSLKALEGYLLVRAPFDGVVTERNVHPGALAGAPGGPGATPLLRIETLTRLRLTVAVPEADAGAIVPKARVEFTVRAWPAKTFHGTLARIAHTVEPRTRTMPVELDIDNRDEKLAPGMFADVAWPIARDAPALFVPPSAIVQTTEKTYVDRVKDGVIEQVPVTRGTVLKDRIEVFAALAPGDLVMKRGSEELKPGARVVGHVADGGHPASH